MRLARLTTLALTALAWAPQAATAQTNSPGSLRQVLVNSRFVTIADNFLEDVGVDFRTVFDNVPDVPIPRRSQTAIAGGLDKAADALEGVFGPLGAVNGDNNGPQQATDVFGPDPFFVSDLLDDDGIDDLVPGVEDALGNAGGIVEDALGQAAGAVANALGRASNAVGNALSQAERVLGDLNVSLPSLPSLPDTVDDIIGDVLDDFDSSLPSLIDSLPDPVGEVLDDLLSGVNGADTLTEWVPIELREVDPRSFVTSVAQTPILSVIETFEPQFVSIPLELVPPVLEIPQFPHTVSLGGGSVSISLQASLAGSVPEPTAALLAGVALTLAATRRARR